MNDVSDFTGWTKRDGTIWLDGYDDARVRVGDHGAWAFVSEVGSVVSGFQYLDDAMRYTKLLAIGRHHLTGPDPLPVLNTEVAADEEFLSERGLRL